MIARGVFAGASAPSGLTVFQYRGNTDYPGDWVQYPNLSWCQPTFPAAGTRYALRRDQPLVLRYRLFVQAERRSALAAVAATQAALAAMQPAHVLGAMHADVVRRLGADAAGERESSRGSHLYLFPCGF